LVAQFGEHRLRLDDDALSARPALPQFEGRRIILGIRPEDLEDATVAGGAPDDRKIAATVDIREDMGSEVFVHFGVGGPAVRGEDVAAAMGEEALEATMVQAKKKGSLWVGRLDRESPAREGERVELVVATRRLHFFDPETGRGIYDSAT
jgi:multiple sugar transport system ATP-binding protein